jgi:hypothetical protein
VGHWQTGNFKKSVHVVDYLAGGHVDRRRDPGDIEGPILIAQMALCLDAHAVDDLDRRDCPL